MFRGGREEEIAQARDYLVPDVAGESILVLRTQAGRLAAYYNVCRHRGSRLWSRHPKAPSTALSGAIDAYGGFFFLNLSPADAGARRHNPTSHLGL